MAAAADQSYNPHSFSSCRKRMRLARWKKKALKVGLPQTFGASNRRGDTLLRQSGAETRIAPASILLALASSYNRLAAAAQEGQGIGRFPRTAAKARISRLRWLAQPPIQAVLRGHRVPAKKSPAFWAGDFLCGMRPKRFSFPPLAAHFLLIRQKKMGGQVLLPAGSSLLVVHSVHVGDEIQNLVGVAPFVVVPRNELDKVVVQHNAGRFIKDTGMGIAG